MNRLNQTYCKANIYTQHCSVATGYPSSGNEKDLETGLSYFGARYYESEMLNIWLSVDPMADKYPSLNPYNYCAWNPIKLVDPDGNDWYLNTETKQIYYNSGARGSNDAGKYGRMQGQDGWSWIGENNMFKETSGKDDRQLSREYFKYSRTQQKGYSIDKSNVGQLVPIFETDILIPSSEYRKFAKENYGREFSFSIKFDLCIGTGGSYDLGIGRKRNGERFVFSTRSVSVGESVGVSVNLNVSSLDSHISSDGSSSNISASHGLITGSLGPGGYSIGVGVGCPGITYSEGKAKTKRIK